MGGVLSVASFQLEQSRQPLLPISDGWLHLRISATMVGSITSRFQTRAAIDEVDNVYRHAFRFLHRQFAVRMSISTFEPILER